MAVAVICEFNPFHNGHKYLLRRAKELTGEPVLAVMSGSFTQRGEVAVCSKFERARAALNNGADLVAELPAAYAVAPAEIFARGGVSIAGAFGDVRYLAFGCECGDIRLLTGAAAAFKNPEVNALIAEQKDLYDNREDIAVSYCRQGEGEKAHSADWGQYRGSACQGSGCHYIRGKRRVRPRRSG